MNLKEIKEILQLMNEHGLSEVEVEKDGLRLKLKKAIVGSAFVEAARDSSAMVIPIPKQGESPFDISKIGGPAAESPDHDTVKSPMVGSFYAAPSPDQPPYVTVGQTVKKGDVLCIIEAMKLMNEIKSEVSGQVMDILVQNGQPVEFDQPLFKIKTQ